ncbi:transcriptional regulator [Pseudogemmobacter humi]|uniref:HTH tetR-type domain-containing protein n=1 Tax=Pseudogemmobacter humi TaxID=2483812 RepID=A0A3P5XC81_9RHOB|nr:transcriptional regulator [Pseudogemmobacter humi]VDC26089.1 hypothetical protein XINFAN_01577 [Pseudogemmobacter humi]
MPRRKILSDAEVLLEARRLFAAGGDKALSFGTLARATGLAASTLAQRFQSVGGLQGAAACAGWQELIAALDGAARDSAGKGPQSYLKALEPGAAMAPMLLALGQRDARAGELAQEWRGQVETALALRIGQGEKARLSAQILFAAWQGRLLWGIEGIRLKDLAKRLT